MNNNFVEEQRTNEEYEFGQKPAVDPEYQTNDPALNDVANIEEAISKGVIDKEYAAQLHDCIDDRRWPQSIEQRRNDILAEYGPQPPIDVMVDCIQQELQDIEAAEGENPYHDHNHGMDVYNRTSTVLDEVDCNIDKYNVTKQEYKTALKVAALYHDLGHPGHGNPSHRAVEANNKEEAPPVNEAYSARRAADFLAKMGYGKEMQKIAKEAIIDTDPGNKKEFKEMDQPSQILITADLGGVYSGHQLNKDQSKNGDIDKVKDGHIKWLKEGIGVQNEETGPANDLHSWLKGQRNFIKNHLQDNIMDEMNEQYQAAIDDMVRFLDTIETTYTQKAGTPPLELDSQKQNKIKNILNRELLSKNGQLE